MVLRTCLVEPGGYKSRQNLAVAENQDTGYAGIGGKDLALVHPLQLGVENHIGTNLQVREPPLECKGGDPNKGEDQQGPAKRRRGGPLAPVMELGGV
jgi:hypothetical protein